MKIIHYLYLGEIPFRMGPAGSGHGLCDIEGVNKQGEV